MTKEKVAGVSVTVMSVFSFAAGLNNRRAHTTKLIVLLDLILMTIPPCFHNLCEDSLFEFKKERKRERKVGQRRRKLNMRAQQE